MLRSVAGARLLAQLRPPVAVQRQLLARGLRTGELLAARVTVGPRRPALQQHVRTLCAAPPAKEPDKPGPPAKWTPRWAWEMARETALHYWHGTKLLAADTKIASQLLMRMLRGITLSRREHNLLVRVLSDLLRVIPLAFFVLVPFMEFALPFAIRLFPNLLPSTFEEGHVREEKRMRLLKVRIGIAQVRERGVEMPGGGGHTPCGRSLAAPWPARRSVPRRSLAVFRLGSAPLWFSIP